MADAAVTDFDFNLLIAQGAGIVFKRREGFAFGRGRVSFEGGAHNLLGVERDIKRQFAQANIWKQAEPQFQLTRQIPFCLPSFSILPIPIRSSPRTTIWELPLSIGHSTPFRPFGLSRP